MPIRILALIIVAIMVAGCSSVDVYTFKKDRVDQRVAGNQGQIMGGNPPETRPENPERTLIGVDIELVGGGSDHSSSAESSSTSSSSTSYEDRTSSVEGTSEYVTETKTKTVLRAGKGFEEVQVEDETEWIK